MRSQLVYLLMVILLPVFVALVWYFADERDRARAQAESVVGTSAERVQANIDRFLTEQELVLSRLAARPQVRAMDPRRCDPQLAEYVQLHPEFPNVLLADLEGNLVCTAQPLRMPATSVRDRAWWNRVRLADGFLVGDVMIGPATGRRLVRMSYPVRDEDGHIAGVLVMPADLQATNGRLMQVSNEKVRTTVRDAAHQVLWQSAPPGMPAMAGQAAAPTQTPSASASASTSVSSSGSASASVSAPSDDEDADAPLPIRVLSAVDRTAWVLESQMSQEDALAETAVARNRLVVAGLVLFALGFFLAWRISLRILRPIEALAQVARRVAGGDLQARTHADDGPPEVHAVATQINRMLEVQSRHERALAHREQLFRSLFDSNPVPHMLQRVGGSIVDVNSAFVQASGYAREELLGRTISEIGFWGTAQDRTRSSEMLQREGGLDGFEGVVRLRNGERRFVLLSARMLEIDGAQHYLHSIVDITERRRVEQALRDREERLSFLLSRTSAVIYTSRAHGDFATTFVSDSVTGLLGYRPSEFLASPLFWSSRLHPADAADFFAAKSRLLEEGSLVQEYRFLHKDGSYRWIHDEIRLYRDAEERPHELIGFWVDVTERRKAERMVRDSENRFRTLTALSSDWYWEQDRDFRFVRSGQDDGAAAGDEVVEGQTHWDTVALNLGEKEWDQHRAVLAAHQQFRDFEICRLDAQQRIRWISISGAPFFDEQGRFQGYRGVGRDITAQKQAADRIYQLAFFDSLTGLPNRRRLMEQLRRALVVAARHHGFGAVLFIDLDNFKSLNDTRGHDIGDLLLQQVASRLAGCVRGVDTVARLGGDEFVVLLDDLSTVQAEAATQAEVVGHKILQTLGQPYDLHGREHRSTPSIGITLFGEHAPNVEELLKQADLAMYQAKNSGRNTLRFFDVGMQANVDRRVALEADLRVALARGELLLHYQPVVLADGRVVGAEALARWNSPSRGAVTPAEFIPVAESSGLILPLGHWVLESACAQLVRWAADPAFAGLSLSVNVSAHQFRDVAFVPQVRTVLERSGANPRLLKFELTESLLAHNVDDIVRKMGALRAEGIGFSLDDFGTGYSSLSYLKRLPLDQIKIDQSFVRDVLTDPSDAAIARTIVALGESLGLNVVAEGVENAGQHGFLVGEGCHAFQGFFFSRPVEIAAFESFVREHLRPPA